MAGRIEVMYAQERYDSRGNPTVQVVVRLDSGEEACALAASGASTGTHEALELRDGDKSRSNGNGVLKAVSNVNKIIAPKLKGLDARDVHAIDAFMRELDGTKNYSVLGANATTAVSCAVTRAAAMSQGVPLYQFIGSLAGVADFVMPVPMCNLLNGGKHALGNLDLQEFMVVPAGAASFAEAIRWVGEVKHALATLLIDRGWATTVGDEGGVAPRELMNNCQALDLLVSAIEKAGYAPGSQIALALDPAASEFYTPDKGKYQMRSEGPPLDYRDQVLYWAGLASSYPIVSIEDGLAEDDWEGWQLLTKTLGDRVQIVGDDLFVTNPKRLARGITDGSANSILIKLNQVGTVTQTLETIKLAQANGFTTVVSHRSGETEDTFIADLAVGTKSGQIKTGSLCRSERVGKYNRLLDIESQRDFSYAGWSAFASVSSLAKR